MGEGVAAPHPPRPTLATWCRRRHPAATSPQRGEVLGLEIREANRARQPQHLSPLGRGRRTERSDDRRVRGNTFTTINQRRAACVCPGATERSEFLTLQQDSNRAFPAGPAAGRRIDDELPTLPTTVARPPVRPARRAGGR